MPRTLFEHLSPDTGAKRILALDGGGVKGVLSLGMLKAVEDELRRRAGGGPDFRLRDYYDLIGGTSTGAIIASGLSLGLSVEELTNFFMRIGPDVFGRTAGDGVFLQCRFDARSLKRALQSVFANRTLGSEELKTGLALFTKRIDTGASWVVTNHPLDAFYDPPPGGGAFANKRYRLVDLLLASSASPAYFDEVMIDIEFDERRRSLKKGLFVDGAVSGNSNPGVQMLMVALDPSYKFGWASGADALMMTSCGSGMRQTRINPSAFRALPPSMRSAHVLRALIEETELQGVRWLQTLSQPRKPWGASAEMTEGHERFAFGPPLLDYQRIDVTLDCKLKAKRHSDPAPPMTPLERLIGRELSAGETAQLDQPYNGSAANMALLHEIGVAAGRTFVGNAYPDPRFDLAAWAG